MTETAVENEQTEPAGQAPSSAVSDEQLVAMLVGRARNEGCGCWSPPLRARSPTTSATRSTTRPGRTTATAATHRPSRNGSAAWPASTKWCCRSRRSASLNRPLDRVYPVLFVDPSSQDQGRAGREPSGLRGDGRGRGGTRDILGIWADDGGEDAKYWLHVFTELKPRRYKRPHITQLSRSRATRPLTPPAFGCGRRYKPGTDTPAPSSRRCCSPSARATPADDEPIGRLLPCLRQPLNVPTAAPHGGQRSGPTAIPAPLSQDWSSADPTADRCSRAPSSTGSGNCPKRQASPR